MIICFKLLESSLEIYRLSRLYNSMNRLFINSTNDFSISKAKNLSRSRTNLHSSQMLTFFLLSIAAAACELSSAQSDSRHQRRRRRLLLAELPGTFDFSSHFSSLYRIFFILSLVIRIRSINSKEFFSLLFSSFFLLSALRKRIKIEI